MQDEQKPIIKVCTHCDCAARGSEEVFDKLRAELHGEALVLAYPECFDACEKGINVSVAGNLLHHVTLKNATQKVHSELARPSLKSDGAGTRPLDDLDDVLGALIPKE